MARAYGASDALDTFLAAFLLPSLVADTLAGPLSSALVPAFVSLRQSSGVDAAEQMYQRVVAWVLSVLAAVALLREYVADIRIRVVNVVDLMVLQPPSEHPHGLTDQAFDALFTTDRPVLFAFHGYPAIIHKLTYRRRNHDNIHVRGYKEEGTTTTPFDMVVLNNMDRYQLALDAIRRIPRLAGLLEAATARFNASIERHRRYIAEHGDDLPEVRDWRWTRSEQYFEDA